MQKAESLIIYADMSAGCLKRFVATWQVLIDDPKELEKIRDRESDITKERIQKVLDAGANVVLTTKGIDDMSLKYFVEAGVIACRRVPKEDLRFALNSSPDCLVRWAPPLTFDGRPVVS